MKTTFFIYADMESLYDKIDTCQSNPEKTSIVKINTYIDAGYSLFRYCLFDLTKNKH